jgi:hypothetical protein
MKPIKPNQSKVLPQLKPFVAPTPTATSNAKPAEAPNPLGLKQVTKRLFVTGEYQDLIAFVKHLRDLSTRNFTQRFISGNCRW